MGPTILEQEAVRQRALPVTVKLYHEMGRSGVIPEKTELLAGVVVEKMTKKPLHALVVTRLNAFLIQNLPADQFQIRPEQPLTFEDLDSEPEPDIAVVPCGDYHEAHPSTARLLIEVAQSSLAIDRAKAVIYAGAGVPEYWICNLVDEIVEVYREPAGETYAATQTFARDEEFAALCAPELRLKLADFLR